MAALRTLRTWTRTAAPLSTRPAGRRKHLRAARCGPAHSRLSPTRRARMPTRAGTGEGRCSEPDRGGGWAVGPRRPGRGAISWRSRKGRPIVLLAPESGASSAYELVCAAHRAARALPSQAVASGPGRPRRSHPDCRFVCGQNRSRREAGFHNPLGSSGSVHPIGWRRGAKAAAGPLAAGLILSYLILSYLILSYLILSYLILSYLLSYLILSYLILSYLILSYLILSYLILSYLILSY
eukprot:SAG31_NODE_368_length_16798_cov_20.422780_16_plen_238_part_01